MLFKSPSDCPSCVQNGGQSDELSDDPFGIFNMSKWADSPSEFTGQAELYFDGRTVRRTSPSECVTVKGNALFLGH